MPIADVSIKKGPHSRVPLVAGVDIFIFATRLVENGPEDW